MEQSVHGSCVALGNSCALLRGPSGIGKSDLALRFLFLPETKLHASPRLVADDQVVLQRQGDKLFACCPQALSGKLEVRGFGIATLEATASAAELKLLIDLDGKAGETRYPSREEYETILGVCILRISLDPFEPSAPLKVALLLESAFEDLGQLSHSRQVPTYKA